MRVNHEAVGEYSIDQELVSSIHSTSKLEQKVTELRNGCFRAEKARLLEDC